MSLLTCCDEAVTLFVALLPPVHVRTQIGCLRPNANPKAFVPEKEFVPEKLYQTKKEEGRFPARPNAFLERKFGFLPERFLHQGVTFPDMYDSCWGTQMGNGRTR